MSNVIVQEALKAAIEYIKSACVDDNFHEASCNVDEIYQLKKAALEGCKAALVEIEKCEPVKGVVIRECLPTLLSDKYIKATDIRLFTSPQPIEKCEPVAWMTNRDDVIEQFGTMAITNAHKNSLVLAEQIIADLFDIPLYTSLHHIEKIEPVGWYCKACKETGLSHCSDPENCGGMVRTYTSPISSKWVGLTYKDKVGLRENTDWYNFPNDLIEATEAKLKQLNTSME